MEAKEITYYVKLKAQECDFLGYTTFVFENLDCTNYVDKFIMCVKYPNWNQGTIELGDVGFLHIKSVVAGIDTWYNGTKFTPYKKTDLVFLKFIREKEVFTGEIILD